MKNLLSLVLAASTVIAFTSSANAADPCKQILCLSGVMKGAGVVDGCSDAVADYFSIIDTKHGDFLPDHTAKKRKKQLDKCPDAGSDNIQKINDKFGRLRGL